jgi:uncharacterized coiled-coil protein SlyX
MHYGAQNVKTTNVTNNAGGKRIKIDGEDGNASKLTEIADAILKALTEDTSENALSLKFLPDQLVNTKDILELYLTVMDTTARHRYSFTAYGTKKDLVLKNADNRAEFIRLFGNVFGQMGNKQGKVTWVDFKAAMKKKFSQVDMDKLTEENVKEAITDASHAGFSLEGILPPGPPPGSADNVPYDPLENHSQAFFSAESAILAKAKYNQEQLLNELNRHIRESEEKSAVLEQLETQLESLTKLLKAKHDSDSDKAIQEVYNIKSALVEFGRQYEEQSRVFASLLSKLSLVNNAGNQTLQNVKVQVNAIEGIVEHPNHNAA